MHLVDDFAEISRRKKPQQVLKIFCEKSEKRPNAQNDEKTRWRQKNVEKSENEKFVWPQPDQLR